MVDKKGNLNNLKKTSQPKRKPQAGKIVTVRIDPIELATLRQTFENFGVPFSTALKLSAHYVVSELKAGRLDMSKAGLFIGGKAK